ncbi:complement C1r subcomponent-like protein [Fukomys damarensis]|uniref:complement C1r subcomponent-like protein n=1 Tax=Fukomys damarensis TaxID=885580 RepID=UPI0008FF04EE|nr:complement C1r subcomponent-like protein [Fukomys damarensis]
MSGSRWLVPEWGNYLWRKPSSLSWLLLWGLLQACPMQGSVLLARRLPQPLMSPGYPEPYPRGQESSTHIVALGDFAVRLVFQDLDLEPSQDCRGDSVMITGSGVPRRLCGQQGPPLGSPPGPGQREFVSSGRSLQLTLRARAPSQGQPTPLHRGFLAVYQAVALSCEPLGQAGGGSGAIPAEIRSCCREPYYQRVSTGVLSCTVQGTWEERRDRQEGLQCVPVCGRPVTPLALHPESLGPSRAPPGSFPWQALTFGVARGWMSEELKWSRLPVASREACEAWLRDRQRPELFSRNMFCVGEELRGSGVCQGDSGSVYVVWDGGASRWVATGIVSWGVGCGKGYGFYTKVLNYMDWIKGVMGGRG